MKMQAPADFSSSCTIEGGKEYVPDDNGIVTVDNPDHAAVLRLHGYTDVRGDLGTPVKGRKAPKPADGDDDDDTDDEFDAMTKGELIEWLEGQDDFDDDDIPAKPKLAQLQKLARDHKAKNAG
ncbi:hypothetical protein POLEWNIK_00450 [Brevundimonas phage vB_BpoS-Polewnik]|nr:hypothetical protein POLEWNIK_00450 [Brevundimonas phage vB_BpoS-Polewnik]